MSVDDPFKHNKNGKLKNVYTQPDSRSNCSNQRESNGNRRVSGKRWRNKPPKRRKSNHPMKSPSHRVLSVA